MMDMDVAAAPQKALGAHPGFRRVFRPGALSVGLILPLETHPGRPAPTMDKHIEMAQKAEAIGVAALWLRDVPFYDPRYGDVAQVFEPMVYMAYLAAATSRITLGTTGIVLPTREPLILAKQAASLDQLSGGRVVLGLSSGDRVSDYPLFGQSFAGRGERYREAFEIYRTVLSRNFPKFESASFGRSDGGLDLVPKPRFGHLPSIAVGQAQQSIPWLAQNMDGFLSSVPNPELLAQIGAGWHEEVAAAHGPEAFRPLAMGGFLDLSAKPDEPWQRIQGGFRAGRGALVGYLAQARAAGFSHIALNPKVTRRPYGEILEELERDVLPGFPAGG